MNLFIRMIQKTEIRFSNTHSIRAKAVFDVFILWSLLRNWAFFDLNRNNWLLGLFLTSFAWWRWCVMKSSRKNCYPWICFILYRCMYSASSTHTHTHFLHRPLPIVLCTEHSAFPVIIISFRIDGYLWFRVTVTAYIFIFKIRYNKIYTYIK